MEVGMVWTQLSFGLHRGKTIPEVLFTDPRWFFEALEAGKFKKHPALLNEVEDLNRSARRIKVPTTEPPGSVVEYYTLQPQGTFHRFEIVCGDAPPYRNNDVFTAFRRPTIDMSVPRNRPEYKKFMFKLREIRFNGSSTCFTKKEAEDFFADSENFA
jgi:hypothetical protein